MKCLVFLNIVYLLDFAVEMSQAFCEVGTKLFADPYGELKISLAECKSGTIQSSHLELILYYDWAGKCNNYIRQYRQAC
jgi:hypothetical protein